MSEDKNLKQAIQEHDKRINNVTALKGDDWQDQLRLTTQGAIRRSSLYNILLFIENDPNLKGVLAYNEFSDRVVKLRSNDKTGLKKGDWRDTDDSLLRFYFDAQYNILLSKDNLLDSIVKASQEHGFDPMKERIETVKWDGHPRAETFFIDYLGAEDNHYTRMVTRKWLAGAIARVYLPGVKFDIIPILEGVQGLGKSTLVRQLAPDYFSDDMKSMKDKDDYQKLMGSWIIELAELSAMNKTDIESIKNFTSAQSDYYRNTYARRPEQHPRRNVFIGSTNHRDYLKDATGERRFYPIKCGIQPVTKNPLKAKQADMLQILAEAKTWFDAGEKLYFDQQTLNEAKAYQQEAQVIDPMRDAVNDYLEMLVPTNWDKLSVSVKHTYYRDLVNSMRLSNEIESQLSKEREPLQQTSVREILSVVFNQQVDDYLAVRTNSNSKRVKLLLDNLEGWEYGRLRLNGKQVRGYHRIL